MTIAEQIKSYYVTINPANGAESFDFEAMTDEASEKACKSDMGWDHFIYEFADGSVLLVNDIGDSVTIYGAAQ